MRDEPPRPLDFASLAAICDVLSARVFICRRRFVPIGTESLTKLFDADVAMLAAPNERHLPGCACGVALCNGDFGQSAKGSATR